MWCEELPDRVAEEGGLGGGPAGQATRVTLQAFAERISVEGPARRSGPAHGPSTDGRAVNNRPVERTAHPVRAKGRGTMNQEHVGTQQQILDLAHRWAETERRGDVAALDALLAEDFVAVGPRGFVLDKQQWLERYRTGALKNASFELEDPSVRAYGDAAVVVGAQTQHATYQGHDATGRFRVTQIVVRADDRWVIVGLHLSPVAEPPTG